MKKTWKNVRPVRVDGDVAYILISNGLESMIDAADVHIVEGWNWTADQSRSGSFYVSGRGGKLHHFLAPNGPGLVDHIDRNTLNNRRSNLRRVTAQENCWNRGKSRRNRSGFKGVCFRRDRGTWLASIRVSGILNKLGTFKTAEQAAFAYDMAARKYFGEFAYLNFPTKFDGVAA